MKLVNVMKLENIHIRTIEQKDNAAIATIVRNSLEEFGANKKGTVYYDPTTDDLYNLFKRPASIYFVAENNNCLLGGAGIFPTDGLPKKTCELVKMYLKPEARGIGLGKLLIQKCIDFAGETGYKNIYIETMPELKQALKVYEKFGFEYLKAPIGNTGHFGCDMFMVKKL
jgi:putative acetyltransferase